MSHPQRTIASLAAALGIGLGAFGAHALKDTLAASGSTDTWEKAVFYHLIHAVALLALSLAPSSLKTKWTSILFTVGILLFSGSLYALALTHIKAFGPITPFGGLAFIAGWIILALPQKS